MRIAVKKILRKHGYPPDLQIKAADTVIEQAKLLANEINDTKAYKLNTEQDLLVAAEPK